MVLPEVKVVVLLLSGIRHIVSWVTKVFAYHLPQGICTPEGHKFTLIANFHNENYSYAKLNLKEYKPGWQKAEPIEKVYVKY